MLTRCMQYGARKICIVRIVRRRSVEDDLQSEKKGNQGSIHRKAAQGCDALDRDELGELTGQRETTIHP